MNKDDNICYTGIHSVKSGNYTKKKYLETMNKHFKKECSVYIKSLKCDSCKKSIKMTSKEVKKVLKAFIKKKTYKTTKNTQQKILKQLNKCRKCKNTKTKKCNFKNYILYSGAEFGKCEDLIIQSNKDKK